MCPQSNSNRYEKRNRYSQETARVPNREFQRIVLVTRRSQTVVAHPYFSLFNYISVSTDLASSIGNTALRLQYILTRHIY